MPNVFPVTMSTDKYIFIHFTKLRLNQDGSVTHFSVTTHPLRNAVLANVFFEHRNPVALTPDFFIILQ